jgi:hypothetical protein
LKIANNKKLARLDYIDSLEAKMSEEEQEQNMNENEENSTEEDENSTKEEDENVAEEDERFPFPRARVVKIMKESIGNNKQIRSEVKDAVNIWLGNLLKKVSKEMGSSMYGSVGIADFQRATRPYDIIDDIIKDEERLLVSVNKLKLDSDHIIRELERFFSTLKSKKE